ncbi:hypothetical protein SimranZ1_98 [Mycobacterium phage SimranZ1]|nr:hypothetical protein SimranZ1_98 [Mycobacterium phage SimranZ1]
MEAQINMDQNLKPGDDVRGRTWQEIADDPRVLDEWHHDE